MKQSKIHKEPFSLTNEGIDTASALIDALLEKSANARDCLRIRLAAEEVMRFWANTLGKDASCTIRCGSHFGQQSIRLSVAGSAADPNLFQEDPEFGSAGNFMLEKLGLVPSFRYEKGVNRVTFQLSRKKPSQIAWLGLAMVFGLLFGLISLSLPAGIQTLLTEGIVSPAVQMLLGALTAVAMPLIFFSICISIMDIGDIATLSRLGKKVLTRFLTLTFAISALCIGAIVWLFPVTRGGTAGSIGVQDILAMVFDAVPSNIISPFLDGNTLQLIFLGGCVGIAFLFLGEQVRQTAEIVRQLDRIVGLLMGGIDRLIPLFVFFTFFTLAASGSITRLGGGIKIVVLTLASGLSVILISTVAMWLRFRIPLRLLVQKTGPSFLVALSTASSLASYPIRVETCKKQLGVDEHTAHFAVPLAQALFKPCGCIIFCVSAFCLAEVYGLPITPGWIVLCLIVAPLLTLAVPPIPGGTKIAYSALFAQLGIPMEGLVLVFAADAMLDFFFTATNTYAQTVLTALCADELGLLDRAVLNASE